ncbi:MAG: hypothetical protein HY202_06380 [Nitrospirae bacterium]|nr:hypothetical protein [Nitrospirota bacterium]MBI3605636.1 hypothetical protein [Nitrospirota bacterium]
MQKIKNTFLLVMLGIFGFLFTYVPDTLAIPAFARKYDVSCVMCHTTFPKLNDFGNNFRDNGYQMGSDSDLPTSLDKGYFPIAFRTTVGYQFIKTGSDNTYTSGLGPTGLDFLSGGTIDRDISFLLVPAGVSSNLGGPATFSLESSWIRFSNLLGSPLLNVKVGFGDLEKPFSTHRSLTILSPYLIYEYSPTDLDGFKLGDYQGELQLMGHTTNGMGIFRYAVDAVSNNTYGGHDTGYYLHVTQSIGGGGMSSGYRGGIFGLYMPMPTTNGTTPLLGPFDPATGGSTTGGSSRPITKYGVDFSMNFIENRLNLFGVYLLGSDDKDLKTDGAGAVTGVQDAKYWGGFIEANYLVTPKAVLVGRYDLIRNTQQADSTFISSANDQDAITLALRYALVIHNRGEIWLHSEANKTEITDITGVTNKDFSAFLGFDFAY